jgi:hypothetical protein
LRASSAFGWDDVGHKISAYIAWDRMTPAARERAFKVLMAAPEDSHLSALYPSDSRADEVKRRELFMIASYWPDIARDPKFPVRQQKYHRGTWHYKDNFWKEADAAVVPVLNLPVAAENSIERLEFFDALLRDPGKPDAEKAIAIAWLLHIGADTHQPLHCTSRVTELEPTGDQGGNLFLLEPRDPNKTLHDNIHWYWDSIIRQSEPRVGSETDCDAKYLLRLARRIMKKHPAGEMGDLRAGQFEQWRLEGYEIATKQVYAGLKRHEAPSQKYKKWAYGVAQKRVALAGYRLAELFNKALSN